MTQGSFFVWHLAVYVTRCFRALLENCHVRVIKGKKKKQTKQQNKKRKTKNKKKKKKEGKRFGLSNATVLLAKV